MTPSPEEDRSPWGGIGWVLLLALLVFALFGPNLLGGGGEEIEFSRFLRLAEQGRISEATIGEGSIRGTFRSEGQDGEQETSFRTVLPPNFEVNALVDTLREQGTSISATRPSGLAEFLLLWGLPLLLIVGGWVLLRRMMGRRLGGGGAEGGLFGFGRSKARLVDRKDMKTTFRDIAGVEEVEEELQELVDYLRSPGRFRRLGAEIPKGVLLVGPPGTGKTLLARAIAGEAEVPFFFVSASEFIEMLVGAGAARVRDLFQKAREKAPAIVFIDEIDSIGRTRSGAQGMQMGSHQEQEQTLQQLLNEMDGFDPNSGVIILAATNRPEVLDQALLRPGRFDRQIQVNLPDVRGRTEILEVHARDVTMADDVDLHLLARRTPGFSGAQLANVINEGALLAGRRKKDRVTMEDLEEAINRVVAGLERRSQVLREEEREMVATHESGHAMVAHYVEHGDRVHRVSIIPRGIGALGYTQQLPEDDRYLISEPELKDRLAVLLGGRAAEEAVFGVPTSGAQDDLDKATQMARSMVTRFGMSEKVGPITVAEQEHRFLREALIRSQDLSDETETLIDREIKALVEGAKRRADELVGEHRAELDRLVQRLLERETLEQEDLKEMLGEPARRSA